MARRNTGPSPEVRAVVQVRDGNCCIRCGGYLTLFRPLDAHHRRPRGMGGTDRSDSNSPANLLTLCRECHGHVESYRAEAYTSGWLVSIHADPLSVPCLVDHGGRWTFLTADGKYSDSPEVAA